MTISEACTIGWLLDWFHCRVDRLQSKSRLSRTLNIPLDDVQSLRLPNKLSDPAYLSGDPDFGINLAISISDADMLIDELEMICKFKKNKSFIKLGVDSVVLEQQDNRIVIHQNRPHSSYRKFFELARIVRSIEKYRHLRRLYDENGCFMVGNREQLSPHSPQ